MAEGQFQILPKEGLLSTGTPPDPFSLGLLAIITIGISQNKWRPISATHLAKVIPFLPQFSLPVRWVHR